MINIIVCKNNFDYIGKDNQMLYHIPKDLAFFKRKTVNHVIIMGRKTFESLPGMLPTVNIGSLPEIRVLIKLDHLIVSMTF